MCTKLKNSKINGYLEINGFVNNNVCTYENLYIRKIKIWNILEMKYSQFTVFNTNRMAILFDSTCLQWKSICSHTIANVMSNMYNWQPNVVSMSGCSLSSTSTSPINVIHYLVCQVNYHFIFSSQQQKIKSLK